MSTTSGAFGPSPALDEGGTELDADPAEGTENDIESPTGDDLDDLDDAIDADSWADDIEGKTDAAADEDGAVDDGALDDRALDDGAAHSGVPDDDDDDNDVAGEAEGIDTDHDLDDGAGGDDEADRDAGDADLDDGAVEDEDTGDVEDAFALDREDEADLADGDDLAGTDRAAANGDGDAATSDEVPQDEAMPDEASPFQDLTDEAEASWPPSPPLAPPTPVVSREIATDEWTTRQLLTVLSRALAVFVALAVIGFGLGALRGGTNVARAEFVYTLDQSVPDSFLREDRRLLTQVATFTSDAVLIPVASQFDIDVDDLRDAINIETVALSEVLRLEVTDPDAGRALALHRAILDQYLLIITAAAPAGDSLELARQRDEVLAELADVDRQRRELTEAGEQDAMLDVRQESIQRQIDLTRDRTAALQGLADDTLVTNLSVARQARLDEELAASKDQLATLEDELAVVVGERAELATATTTEPALLREVARLEAQLSTIDEELSQRELGPLVASPIRELSDPTVIERSALRAGLRRAALAALLAVPVAAFVAYRARRRQLWFG